MAFKLPQLFGSTTPATPAAAGTATSPTGAALANHRQLARIALRDTLKRHSIAEDWVGLDTLVRMGKSQEPRLDVRLVIHHWDRDLVIHSMALQEEFTRRLQLLDPLSKDWMTGVSWQFALPDDGLYQSLPKVKPAAKPAGRPAQGDASARADRALLLRMFDEPQGGAPKANQAYAATEPAALH